MIALALLLQASPVTSATGVPPQRFSILYEVCPAQTGNEVIVCGSRDNPPSPRLPLPDDAPPTPNYVKPDSGDYRDNAMHGGSPCVALQGGCQVGFGPPLADWVKAGVHALQARANTRREARARAADGDRRQPIDLAIASPSGRLEP